eukprot:TRINITY_DN4724_c0_g1_i2.p1 TRINITY_DN4724_c0_g1~~TRINITY_DN4724_c0_g1_i2.p1  ORF type:complete len:157 (+),score=18.89 TRINITY_DN4724_c0_g1_i2:530-1000(+)
MIQLNMASLTMLTRLLVPKMLERGYGKVMNVASIVAYYTGPYQAVYNASKAYVLSFSNALSIELKDTPVTVTAICPGFTRSGFFPRAGANTEKLYSIPGLTSDPDEVAFLGYPALFRGDATYITGFKNWVFGKSFNLMPSIVAGRIAEYVHQNVCK